MLKNQENPDHCAALARRKGVIFGLSAYVVWGFFPVYFKLVKAVPPLEMVSHRVLWSFSFLLVLITWNGAWPALLDLLKRPKYVAALAASTLMISSNWLVFIYSVSIGELLQASLGYFINPLASVLLGFFFLGERLARVQWLSLFLAMAGVGYQTIQYGGLPWISLVLGITFALYGLIRKALPVEPLVGLTIETLLLAPLALGYLFRLHHSGAGSFLFFSTRLDLLVAMSGVITAIPLLLFAAAAKRLRLATVGFLQYITPSLQLLLAVAVYGEHFTRTHLVSFLLIWCGLALYSVHAYRTTRVPAA